MKVCNSISICLAALSMTGCLQSADTTENARAGASSYQGDRVVKSEKEWKSDLSPEQYRVTRQCGTERPGTGALLHNKAKGTYACVACGHDLFASDAKYDSGSGWPSFWQPITSNAVQEKSDASLGAVRTEVVCPRCGAHLGHVFEDGPEPTGQRYCINSVSLDFVADPQATKSKSGE